jgi:hypothetical protein
MQWSDTAGTLTDMTYPLNQPIFFGGGVQTGVNADVRPIQGLAVADFGPAGTIGFCTIYGMQTLEPLWAGWNVYGDLTAIDFASQPGFWFKMVNVESLSDDGTLAGAALYMFLFPDLNSCIEYPSTQSVAIPTSGVDHQFIGLESSPLQVGALVFQVLADLDEAQALFSWTTFPAISSF